MTVHDLMLQLSCYNPKMKVAVNGSSAFGVVTREKVWVPSLSDETGEFYSPEEAFARGLEAEEVVNLETI